MNDEYRVLTFLPEKQAQGLETMLQEAADEGFEWVDMISRERLVFVIMKREKNLDHQHHPVAQAVARSKPTVIRPVSSANTTIADLLAQRRR